MLGRVDSSASSMASSLLSSLVSSTGGAMTTSGSEKEGSMMIILCAA